jgi:hypothetical protein
VNKTILLLGITILISGLIITYLLILSFLKINQSLIKIQEETESMFTGIKNMFYSTTIVGGALVLIGFYLIKRALKS